MASGALGAGIAVTAAVLALAACSPSPPHPARTPRATAAARPDAKTAGTASHGSNGQTAASNGQTAGSNGQTAGSGPGQLGSALAVSDSNGTQLDVTLTKVIDPAQGANPYSNPASGKHFVGVKLRVQNKATTTYQNNANNETTIILSDGKKLHANYNPIANCGNFDNGQIKLKSGAASTGCVTFQVPKKQKVIQVSYGNTVFPGTTAEWRIS
jgi:hypothetical protein